MRLFINYFYFIIVLFAGFSSRGYALEFRAGNYYFDNTKLQFDSVKFVLGNDSTTHIYDMTKLQDKNWWVVELNQDINDIERYCFLCGNIAAGVYNISPDSILVQKDTIQNDTIQNDSTQNNNISSLRRTMLFPVNINILPNYVLPNWIFFPLNDDEISNGYWRTTSSYDAVPSMTLPLVHINTEDSLPITTKDYYLGANLWIEDEQHALGSPESPLAIEVKGRGNWTWNFLVKKPYKIKFAKKQSPLGLDNSKHFILKPDAGDNSGYLRNESGFELSRQLGMPYTTRQYPVELVLNGEYEGLYFLCEKIRVEDGRVEIIEQQDNDTNPENVSGGWLLELAYEGDPVIAQHENNDRANGWISFMSKSPEYISQVQRDYIHDFIFKGDSCIYVSNKTDTGWEQYFDINTLARFYVIHEVMDNVEAFSGSLFMYKDWGEDEKLHFGPVWDFDNSANKTYPIDGHHFIFEYGTPFPFIWIKELLKFPHFQQKIREVWKEFKDNDVIDKVVAHVMEWKNSLRNAELCDKQRWPYYASGNTNSFLTDRISRVAWLDTQWNIVPGDVNLDRAINAADVTAIYNYILNGDDTFLSTSDVNGDGAINAADLTFIYNRILGQ